MLHILKSFLPMAEKIYNKKSTLDILKYICVREESVIYTDLETTIAMPAEDKRNYLLPIPILKKILNTKPQIFHINIPENGRMSISYDSREISFPVPAVEEYPLSDPDGFTKKAVWSETIFRKLFNQIPYASKDILRPALTGIFIMQNESFSSVATDGHVLQWITDLDSDEKCELIDCFECIMPVISINLVSRYCRGDVEVNLSERFVRFTFNNGTMVTCKLIKEKYPDFKKVMPEMNGNEIIVKRKDILESIKAALPFSNSDSHRAYFNSNNGHVKILVKDTEEETSYASTFDLENKKGQDLAIALDLKLLEKTILGLSDDYLHWHYGSSDDPSIFTGGNGIRNLVMPIRYEEDV
jgi:DNA polymerase III sliding clamp (beta) subunit (PCNA family)